MYVDEVALGRHYALFLSWGCSLDDRKTDELAAKLASEHCKKDAIASEFYKLGTFNRLYKVQLKDGPDVLVRFPALGRSMFHREKTIAETHTMQYFACNSRIPIPRLYGCEDSAVGPYLAAEFVPGKPLSDYIKSAERTEMQAPVLNPDVDIAVLRRAYYCMALIIFALNIYRFPTIGSLTQVEGKKEWTATERAMTSNMNSLVEKGNVPPQRLSQRPYNNASDYFVSLANDQFHHLETQRNGAIEDEDDCRKKYIARCLFRKIAKTFSTDNGPFPLVCESLHPKHVIVDEKLTARGVIDWGFSYTAPAELAHCSPWWLLLARPGEWDGGLDDFISKYIPRHNLFLETLRSIETNVMRMGTVLDSPLLSDRMAQSMENGQFWFCRAATNSYEFDEIYWKFIHPKYYGDVTSIADLLGLLSEEERAKVEPFVRMKVEQADGTYEVHRTICEIMMA